MDDFSCSREIIPHKRYFLRYFYEEYNPISQKLIHANIFDIHVMFDGKFGQIKHIIYRLALPSALFGIEMFTICWNFQNCIFVCYHIWRHILPWWRFEQFHVDWVPLVNKTCINTIFWKKDDRYTIQKFSRCFVVAKSVISSRVHFEWVLLEIMIESSKLTSS